LSTTTVADVKYSSRDLRCLTLRLQMFLIIYASYIVRVFLTNLTC